MVENIVAFRLLRLSAARSKSTEVENDTWVRNQGLDFCAIDIKESSHDITRQARIE